MYEEHEDGSFTLHMCEWYEQGRRLVGEYETLADGSGFAVTDEWPAGLGRHRHARHQPAATLRLEGRARRGAAPAIEARSMPTAVIMAATCLIMLRMFISILLRLHGGGTECQPRLRRL